MKEIQCWRDYYAFIDRWGSKLYMPKGAKVVGITTPTNLDGISSIKLWALVDKLLEDCTPEEIEERTFLVRWHGNYGPVPDSAVCVGTSLDSKGHSVLVFEEVKI